ncbi:dihydrodipicolinate synthase family protein [Paenibacillus sp. GD4]|uniref:dihydrodipicolinate synthase family protein n=1 Tax=Paenibacillus sp. GD4 TaxID=3068890 RepID=UPI00279670B3|nr:dihydrodipicolinate synthase family protein [Paenibacillus sp. GD4]MDQ1912768.1 dihydrodipicolinate synthase family protein [Paenibacillus sp. GD4]
MHIKLPRQDGSTYLYEVGRYEPIRVAKGSFEKRTAFSAAHVVVDPFATTDPILNPKLDIEASMAYRHRLWSLGFGVAEAMDTAQRGMGLQWEAAKTLIAHSVKEAKSVGGLVASGAGTDHLPAAPGLSLEQVEAAYEEQCSYIEGLGGRIILMASRALAAVAQGPDDYRRVYGRILSQVKEPVILHWLGDMFDPALAGYWGHKDDYAAMEVCLDIIRSHADKVDGIKISLLDAGKEIEMRRKLPQGVRMYTGDDFNYPELISGDEQGYSHALLGIFDAIAPVASSALQALDQGRMDAYYELMNPTLPLSRHIFQKPTYAYKTGVVFLAYLNGFQSHFRMVGGAEGQRSATHLAELFVLADEARLLADPELAAKRMQRMLLLAGVE